MKFVTGNILLAEADALVNSVNTVGVMGKGIALSFKKAYPENYEFYRKECKENRFDVGKLLVFSTGKLIPRYIINFPTKKHWKNPSKFEWIETGLDKLIELIEELQLSSIAIPPLGSGNGRLEWLIIKKLMTEKLSNVRNCDVFIYEPTVFPEIHNEKVFAQDKLTPARAMILFLFYRYKILGDSLNMLVSQKLAYFLQRFGEPMKLRYEKGYYGPYAYNLIKVLNYLNGTFLRFNKEDLSPINNINLITNKKQVVEDYINQNLSSDQIKRLEKVSMLIEGFESPFSLELLATVDFVLNQHPNFSPEEILENIHFWTIRKKELMKLHHIKVAYDRLMEYPELKNRNILD